MLFPIDWDEPFRPGVDRGNGMRHAGVGVPRRVRARDREERFVSGYVCADAAERAQRAAKLAGEPMDAAVVRQYVEENFSVARMVDEYHDLYLQMLAGKSQPESAVA